MVSPIGTPASGRPQEPAQYLPKCRRLEVLESAEDRQSNLICSAVHRCRLRNQRTSRNPMRSARHSRHYVRHGSQRSAVLHGDIRRAGRGRQDFARNARLVSPLRCIIDTETSCFGAVTVVPQLGDRMSTWNWLPISFGSSSVWSPLRPHCGASVAERCGSRSAPHCWQS